MNIKIRFLFFIVVLLVINSYQYGQPVENIDNINSVKNHLKFGNYLFGEKDYLRALNEFREYLKVEDNDTVRFKFADCFYRINRFPEAEENYKSLFFHSSLSDEARLGFYKSLFFEKDYQTFRNYVEQSEFIPAVYEKEIIRLKLISHFFDDSYLPDTNKFIQAFPDSNQADVRKFYFQKKYPLHKSPSKAALLSAVVPGLGKLYTGEISDGITAFIATGLLTFLAGDNFNHKHNFRGWLFAGMAALTYAGNIYGSAASAQLYNAGIRLSFDRDVKLYFEQRNYMLPKDDWSK